MLAKTIFLFILLSIFIENIHILAEEKLEKEQVELESIPNEKEETTPNELEEQVAFKPTISTTNDSLEVFGGETDGNHSRIKRKSKKAKTHDPKDENYHVKYETKFAFQNVDEQGLRVKYNKTENVFYGQAVGNGDTNGSTGSPDTTCTDSEGRLLKLNDVISVKNQCKTDICTNQGTWQTHDVCNQNECTIDSTKDFPDCCICKGMPPAYPPGFAGQRPPQSKQYYQYQPQMALPYPGGQSGYGGALGSYYPPSPGEESGGFPGEESLEMRECRKTQFLDTEEVKPIPGMCIMCHKGLGTYRYVEGCPRIDCDEFIPGNPNDDFPECCPMCKGSNKGVGFTWNAPKPADEGAAPE